jgi:hypothetical protein
MHLHLRQRLRRAHSWNDHSCIMHIMQVCRNATAAAPCYPGTYTGDCKTYNKSNCGLQYSDQQNAAYCAIDTPSTWPPLLQVGAPLQGSCQSASAAGVPPLDWPLLPTH